MIARLRRKLAQRARAPPCFLQAVQDIRVGGRLGNAQYQYTLQADDLDELNDLGPADARRRCATLPELRDVTSDQQNAGCRCRSPSIATPPRGSA